MLELADTNTACMLFALFEMHVLRMAFMWFWNKIVMILTCYLLLEAPLFNTLTDATEAFFSRPFD